MPNERRLVVSDGSNAREANKYRVAQSGSVRLIRKAFVSEGGVVRQYWDSGEPPPATPEPPPDGVVNFWKRFEPALIQINTSTRLYFYVDNRSNGIEATDVEFIDNVPLGITVGGSIANNMGGNAVVTPTSIALTGGEVPAGEVGVLSVDVSSALVDTYVNVSGELTCSFGSGGTASATLTTRAEQNPDGEVGFSKYFSPDVVEINTVSELVFKVNNTSNSVNAIDVAFIDSLPSGLDIIAVTTDNMGGQSIVDTGNDILTYTGGSVPAGQIGTLIVTYQSALVAAYVNTSEDMTTGFGNHGTATAGLTVQDTSPPATPPPEWTTDQILIKKWTINPVVAVAEIVFDLTTGFYTYSNHPDGTITEQYVNPPITASLEYEIKVDQTTANGSTITGTLGSWIELNQASLTWSLDQASAGLITETANISIRPVGGTAVVKVAVFEAGAATSGSKNVWTTEQRDLVEEKEAVDATCDLTLSPNGTATGDADTSGSFNENWHEDAPDGDPTGFTVRVNLISGDTPDGTLGSAISVDQVRTWQLLATSGEDKSCALDVIVDDSIQSVTKRVTMHSVRTVPPVDPPAWTATQWNLSDILWPQELALLTKATITFKTDGTATGEIENSNGGPVTQETENWHPDAPTPLDLENYEVKFEASSGVLVGSPAVGVWHRLDVERVWEVEYATRPASRDYTLTASVRAVGGAAVDKSIVMTVVADNGGTPL